MERVVAEFRDVRVFVLRETIARLWPLFPEAYVDQLNGLRIRLVPILSQGIWVREALTQKEYYTIVVAPTMDCNLRCTYCYEGDARTSTYMTKEVADATMSWAEKELSSGKWRNGLHALRKRTAITPGYVLRYALRFWCTGKRVFLIERYIPLVQRAFPTSLCSAHSCSDTILGDDRCGASQHSHCRCPH